MNRSRLVFFALLIAAVASVTWGRTWTDNQGKQIKAKFVRVHQGNVVLSVGRRVITVPFGNFSPEDQDYIRQELKAKGQEHLLPPAGQTGGALPGLRRGRSAGGDEELASELGSGQPASSVGQMRTWTDVRGRTIEAQLVGVSGDQVVLLKEGQRVMCPLAGLSPMDQQYVRDQLAARREGVLTAEEQYGPGMEEEPMSMPGAEPASSFPGPTGSRPPRYPSARSSGTSGYRPGNEGSAGPPEYAGEPDESSSSDPMYGEPGNDPGAEPAGPGYEEPSAGLDGPPGYGASGIPAPGMPSGGFAEPSPPDEEMVEYAECGKCKREVPAHLGAGDRCPHCGVVWDYEETADGRKIDASGREVSGGWMGGAAGAVAIFVCVLFALARLVANRQ